MAQKKLDVSAIQGLIEVEKRQEQAKIAQKIRNKQYPTEPRDFDTWFRLPVRFADCSQGENCLDERPESNISNHTMVAMVNGSEICRYCFMAGANK